MCSFKYSRRIYARQSLCTLDNTQINGHHTLCLSLSRHIWKLDFEKLKTIFKKFTLAWLCICDCISWGSRRMLRSLSRLFQIYNLYRVLILLRFFMYKRQGKKRGNFKTLKKLHDAGHSRSRFDKSSWRQYNVYLLVCHVPFLAQGAVRTLHRTLIQNQTVSFRKSKNLNHYIVKLH